MLFRYKGFYEKICQCRGRSDYLWDKVIVKADTQIERGVTGKDGKVTFTSDLPLGQYYVKELEAPKGYVKSDKVFDVDALYQGDKVKVIEFEAAFENAPIKVEISKTDITGEKELPGAKLSVIDSDGKLVESWTSEAGKTHMIERLPVGKYTLREESAPYGYKVAKDVTFEVKETAEIQKVSMKDEQAVGKIVIEKTDKVTGKPIEGVVFEVRDKDGKVVDTLTTDKNGHAESKELPICTYNEDGSFKEDIHYTVVETKAAEGYILDETAHDVVLRYKDWSEYREGSFVWADMIKRDLDSCILQAGNNEQFLELLSDKGYEVKQGKYLAVKPQGMTRFRRCKTLGDMYSDEAIRERIEKEDISFYREQQKEVQPVLCKCKVRRYRRAKMSGLQKRYYAKLYRIGKLKKKPYSQVWKYKEDIRKMHKLQEEYLFLVNHDIHSAEELVSVISSLTDKRKEVSAEKSRIYKARERSRELFDIVDDMKELEPAEKSFLQGDEFFTDEHLQWETLKQKLLSQGYSLEEVEALRKHYKEEYSKACAKERAVFKELNIGKSIWKSLIPDSVSDGKDAQYNKETIRDRKEQPER